MGRPVESRSGGELLSWSAIEELLALPQRWGGEKMATAGLYLLLKEGIKNHRTGLEVLCPFLVFLCPLLINAFLTHKLTMGETECGSALLLAGEAILVRSVHLFTLLFSSVWTQKMVYVFPVGGQ